MNISLIGMMGCGKSTIGKQLSKKLKNYTFIDTDEEIVKSQGCSINEIFASNGETFFRELESKTLENILKNDNQVISTGGGIVKSEFNLKQLKENSIVVYLKADSNTLFERVKNNKDRPLLNVDNMQEKIIMLLKERSSKYEQAHFTIDTNNKNIDIIINEIVQKIGSYGKS